MSFERVTPESVGIHSKAITDFLRALEEKGMEAHSLMIFRHGKVCAEGWWKPYAPEILHPVFSFSIALTSTAIGFAEQEGLLSLEEHIVDLFPAMMPEFVADNLKKMTVFHLLTMSCGHDTEDDSRDRGDWIRRFLAHPVVHEPGSYFLYNTEGTNLLAAILYRKTGCQLVEYLRPRLFEPLGISGISCIKLSDGTDIGGGGFRLHTEDMARFIQFVLNRGSWEGRQLLRADWFDRATATQVETYGAKDWGQGYGFKFWRCMPAGVFRADGAFGQYGVVLPHQDAAIIMTSAVDMMQEILDSIWEHLLPGMEDAPLDENFAALHSLRYRLEHLEIHPFPANRSDSCAAMFGDKHYVAQGESCGFDCLIGGARFPVQKESPALESLSFAFLPREARLTLKQGGVEYSLPVGMDGHFRTAETPLGTFSSQARWRSMGVLELEIRRLEISIAGARLLLRFSQDGSMTLERESIMVVNSPLDPTPPVTLIRFQQV